MTTKNLDQKSAEAQQLHEELEKFRLEHKKWEEEREQLRQQNQELQRQKEEVGRKLQMLQEQQTESNNRFDSMINDLKSEGNGMHQIIPSLSPLPPSFSLVLLLLIHIFKMHKRSWQNSSGKQREEFAIANLLFLNLLSSWPTSKLRRVKHKESLIPLS